MREINSFDNPEEVADLLTEAELRASLAHNEGRRNYAAVVVLEDEIRRRDEYRRRRMEGEA